MNLLRGGIYLADIGGGLHKTVLIVSDDGINIGLKQPIVARVSDNSRDRSTQTAVELDAGEAGLDRISYVLCHDLYTLDAADFITYFGAIPIEKLFEVERRLRLALRLE